MRQMMRVFHREKAGRPLRIIWTLEEVGEPYELTVMSREESRGEEHRDRHPLGRVPVLEDDEGFVFESAAMCLHLADMHPEAGLVPALGTHDRALVYQWACFAPAEIEPALFEAWTQAERDPERAAAARKRFDAAVLAVADSLNGNEYLVGAASASPTCSSAPRCSSRSVPGSPTSCHQPSRTMSGDWPSGRRSSAPSSAPSASCWPRRAVEPGRSQPFARDPRHIA